MGGMHWPPNAEGIRWFTHSVWPEVAKKAPGSTLTIIGKSPPPDLKGQQRKDQQEDDRTRVGRGRIVEQSAETPLPGVPRTALCETVIAPTGRHAGRTIGKKTPAGKNRLLQAHQDAVGCAFSVNHREPHEARPFRIEKDRPSAAAILRHTSRYRWGWMRAGSLKRLKLNRSSESPR